MQKEEYWKNFLTSGKVSDYLGYCNAQDKAEESNTETPDDAPEDKRKHNAGFY